MLIRTLEQAEKIGASIWREIRYYAKRDGMLYDLEESWEQHAITGNPIIPLT